MADELADLELAGFLEHHRSGYFRDLDLPDTARTRPVDYLLVWVLEGGLTGTVGDRRVRAEAGDLVLFPPRVPQRYGPHGDSWQWLWVHYGGRAAPAVHRLLTGSTGSAGPTGSVGPAAPRVPLGLDPQIRQRFLELVGAATVTRPAGAGVLHLDSCLHSIVGLMDERLRRRDESGSTSRTARDQVAVLREWITAHVAAPITMATLTEHSGVSASQLSRLFRSAGVSAPMAYVTEVRMAQARALLAETDLPIGQIARAVGYPDPYHFSRRFAATTGRAPTAYRRESMQPRNGLPQGDRAD